MDNEKFFKCWISYWLFKKCPAKILRGPSIGPVRVVAILTEGEIADKKCPNETEHWATRQWMAQLITNTRKSLFKFVIQWNIVVYIIGSNRWNGS